LALRFPAAAIERELASRVQLDLIESAAAPQLEEPGAAHECPGPDDLLDFCQGRLRAERTVALQHHLDLCPACMDVVTLALNDWEAPPPAEWLDVAPNFRRGDRVDGRYVIVRFIASGGMGEVYEAIDSTGGDRVALKAVLAAASDQRDSLRAFRREARLAGRVLHPNVCRVHDASALERAGARPLVPHFAMDLVEGETLQERIARAPLPLADTLEIARQILLGVQAIHRAGVLHLDIKSNNIMLRGGSERLAVVILDFGLSRRAERRARAARTSRGGAKPPLGSWAFMAPERAQGCAPSVQNDVFAFGVVLFQMLTGELPFTPLQRHARSSIAECSRAPAPAPSQRAPAVPAGLDALVRRCLAERERRYPNIDAVLAAFAEAQCSSS